MFTVAGTKPTLSSPQLLSTPRVLSHLRVLSSVPPLTVKAKPTKLVTVIILGKKLHGAYSYTLACEMHVESLQ